MENSNDEKPAIDFCCVIITMTLHFDTVIMIRLLHADIRAQNKFV